MHKDELTPQHTYRTEGGKLLYIHAIHGQKVVYCEVGSVDRLECSLGRFASRIAAEVPNQ